MIAYKLSFFFDIKYELLQKVYKEAIILKHSTYAGAWKKIEQEYSRKNVRLTCIE